MDQLTTKRMVIKYAWLAIAIGTLSSGSPVRVKGTTLSESLKVVDHIIEQVRAAHRFDRLTVERIIGGRLHHKSSTGFFTVSETDEVHSGPIVLYAELRQPIAHSGAEAGPMLTVQITSGCPERREIAKRYQPWKLTNVPSGHSLQEQTYWSRDESWGTLSFGFTEAAPDCLHTVVFDPK